MKLVLARVRNFRRLEDVSIDFEESETVFVGPNNSGKTSAADVFRLFLKSGDFSIHDFSVPQLSRLDDYGHDKNPDEKALPCIELDLWFSIDPNTEFGRASLLLPDTEQDYERVGVRLRFMVNDAEKLKEGYLARFMPQAGGLPRKSLSHYLSLPGTLKQHFYVGYYALSGSDEGPTEKALPPDEGKRLLKSLVRVEFVDAQRKIDDHEHAGSTRLSKVFTGYYKRNLTQVQAAEAANLIIDKHNEDLSEHYATVFSDLLDVIQGLGVPSVNDRTLKVISSLVAEEVLKSNTTLAYVDAARDHALPENYNGLGVKNLIYLAVQICENHQNWMKTDEDRPLALLLFIEEPEVHLHAQAQQTFIANAWRIILESSKRCGEEDKAPQLVVTTHSSHILDTVDFAHVRYFRRSHCAGDDPLSTTTLNASTVLNLRRFNPLLGSEDEADIASIDEAEKKNDANDADPASDAGASKVSTGADTDNDANTSDSDSGDNIHANDAQETLDFLKRYLNLTHCDLFFADAAILVEGTVEKLLLPAMISRVAPGLRQRYLTVLEVGGAYAHRFAGLLQFLSIPYLIVTDIDAVDPGNKRSACRADCSGAVSSNAALKFFLSVSSIKELVALSASAQRVDKWKCYVAYQRPSVVDGYGENRPMHGRTFEETFVYENLSLFRDGSLRLGHKLSSKQEFEAEYQSAYEAVKSSTFKKTDFALSVASSKAPWVTPKYIADGLRWLEVELHAVSTTTGKAADT